MTDMNNSNAQHDFKLGQNKDNQQSLIIKKARYENIYVYTYVCMCVCIYVYIYTCIYMYTHLCEYIYTTTFISHMHMQRSIRIYMHICICREAVQLVYTHSHS